MHEMEESESPQKPIGSYPKFLAVLCAVGVLPYFLLKLGWIFGAQWGIEYPSPAGAEVVLIGNIITAALDVLLVFIVWVLGRPQAMRIPWWIILVPAWFAAGLLLPFIVTGPVITMMVFNGNGTTDGSLSSWVGPLGYLSFATQAVGIVLMLGWYLNRRWGKALVGAGTRERFTKPLGLRIWVFSGALVTTLGLSLLAVGWFHDAVVLLRHQSSAEVEQQSLSWLSDFASFAFACLAVFAIASMIWQQMVSRKADSINSSRRYGRWILLLAASSAAIAGSSLYGVVLMLIGAGEVADSQGFWVLLLAFGLGLICGAGAMMSIATAQEAVPSTFKGHRFSV